jgi:hypothetical protein
MSWRKELKSGLSLIFLLSRADQVHMIHPIDHLVSCQQRSGNSYFTICKFHEFYLLLSVWVALGKERIRNLIWILDDHKSSNSPWVIKWELWPSISLKSHLWWSCQSNFVWWSIYLGGGMFSWHNFNCCKFIMPWPRYRMNSSRFLNWFKCISQVIRVLDAHIKGQPTLCLVSFEINLFF